MLTRKLILFAIALAMSTQAFATDFKDAFGTKWKLDLPPGWRIVSHPESLKEGVQLVISSSPSATWDKPFPAEGEALIGIGFYFKPGSTPNAAFAQMKDFKNPTQKKLGKHDATTVDIDTAGISKSATVNVVEVGNRIIIAKLYDNGRADSCQVLTEILDSLEVVK